MQRPSIKPSYDFTPMSLAHGAMPWSWPWSWQSCCTSFPFFLPFDFFVNFSCCPILPFSYLYLACLPFLFLSSLCCFSSCFPAFIAYPFSLLVCLFILFAVFFLFFTFPVFLLIFLSSEAGLFLSCELS